MSDPEQRHTQWIDAAQWFAKADEDIVMAEMALGRELPLVDPAAFHCQQATEKIIKALLVAAAVKAPRIHDLDVLATVAGLGGGRGMDRHLPVPPRTPTDAPPSRV